MQGPTRGQSISPRGGVRRGLFLSSLTPSPRGVQNPGAGKDRPPPGPLGAWSLAPRPHPQPLPERWPHPGTCSGPGTGTGFPPDLCVSLSFALCCDVPGGSPGAARSPPGHRPALRDRPLLSPATAPGLAAAPAHISPVSSRTQGPSLWPPPGGAQRCSGSYLCTFI
ncbi:translation initiation factor IF-2-like [Vulpes lagopus]|uniref:translation initiation factor IF-2-like n=1 Tax=Vulpes lagopus TaxID=494514 RepID=UPI001BC9B401|nr:translation initiation factor IF-2-like [Vulpes lagopus]